MQGVFGSLKEIFTKSFNRKFYLKSLALYLVMSFLLSAISLPVVFLTTIMLLSGSFSIAGLSIAAIIFLAFFFVVLVLASVFTAIGLALGRDFLEGKQFSLSSAFEKAKPGILPLIKTQLAVSILFVLLFLAIVAPGIAGIASAFSGYGLQGAVSSMYAFLPVLLVAIAAVVLVFLVLLPFLLVIGQVAFFERLGVFKAMKRAWELGKRNFLYNWAFAILAGIIVFIVFFAVLLLSQAIAGAIGNATAASSIIAYIVTLIISVVLYVWVWGISLLFSAKIYLNNIGAGAAKKAVAKIAVQKAARAKPRARKKKK